MSETQTADTSSVHDPFFYFYETFLKSYDSDTRKLRGVYYTPLPVVRFIIRAVDDILQQHFNKPKGVASEQITVLDFAAGTGTFLQEIISLAMDKVNVAERKSLVHDRLLSSFYGFEYGIAAYAIAHLKLANFLKDNDCELTSNKKQLQIYLTNTLEEVKKQEKLDFLPALTEEVKAANCVKEQPILIIMGNPPYSAASQNKNKWIVDLVKGSRDNQGYYYVDDKPINEKNPKGLQDDYVKFIRFAENKMEKVKHGVIAIITNHGFIDNTTFRGMRQHLMRTFNQIYVLDLHGNIQKKETTPDGELDNNVFDIKQGVSIAFMVKKPNLQKKVFHADLYGTRNHKYEVLGKNNIKDIKWQELEPQTPFYLFIPHDNKLYNKYKKFHSIKDIFSLSKVGITTGNDNLFINFSKKELLENVSNNFGTSADKKLIKKIAYRPFDDRYIYYDVDSKKFNRPRKAIMQHMLDLDNLALVTVRMVAEGVFNHAFIANKIIGSELTASNKGGAYLFPLYTYDLFSDKQKKTENFASSFREWIDTKYNKKLSPEVIFNYIYAKLYSPLYRKQYSDFLRIEFPRIPFPDSLKELNRIANIGKTLIKLHLLDFAEPLDSTLEGNGDMTIKKVNHTNDCLYINPTCYFTNISKEVYNFQLCGYLPIKNYLNARKGRELSHQDITAIKKITEALVKTQQQMELIDK